MKKLLAKEEAAMPHLFGNLRSALIPLMDESGEKYVRDMVPPGRNKKSKRPRERGTGKGKGDAEGTPAKRVAAAAAAAAAAAVAAGEGA